MEPCLGVYAALVTATGFKPGVASAKAPGGFDSHPLPFFRSLIARVSGGLREANTSFLPARRRLEFWHVRQAGSRKEVVSDRMKPRHENAPQEVLPGNDSNSTPFRA